MFIVVGDLIQRGNYPAYFQIPETAISHIEYSWKQNAPMLYGRFDFAYDGRNIKMLEYNADTPTGLLEASVAQWLWIEQVSGIANRDQFNSIHEDLIKRWKTILPRDSHVHFAASQEAGREDWGNLEYLMDTAYQAHLQVSELSMENIGWNGQDFVDLHNQPIQKYLNSIHGNGSGKKHFLNIFTHKHNGLNLAGKCYFQIKQFWLSFGSVIQTIHYWSKPIPMTCNKLCLANG